MASTEQRSGFRLPWSGPTDARPDGLGPDERGEPLAHPAAQNRFQPILLRAMRAAAEENRNAMLAAAREEAEASITGLHARSTADSETLRQVATNEITAISDYTTAEIERLTAEADEAIAARRAQLGQSLEEQTTRVDQEVEQVRSRVAAFEADMAAFFGRLDVVADPAEFAALTAQLPEPPRLRDAADDLSAFMPGGSAYTYAAAAGAPSAPAATPAPERKAAASAETPAPAETSAPTETPAAEPAPTAPAAEAAPEPAATRPEPSPTAEAVEPAPAVRSVGEPMVTTIVVAGLVNIASIAAFKRLVSGLHGVQSVAVSSGPGGEFVFKTSHEKGVALGDEVTLLPGFGARIVDSREGVLHVSARDPGAAA